MNLLANFRLNVLRVMTERKISTSHLAETMGWSYRHTFEVLYERKDLYLTREVEPICTALKVDPIAMMEE